MKTLTMRDLNQKTATVLDALERGETFEVRRNGKAVGYLTPAPGGPTRDGNWKTHFEWLSKQKRKAGGFVDELVKERARQRLREVSLSDLA